MIDVPWMMQYFPQLSTWPRVDMVSGRDRGKPIAATRNPQFNNVTHYNAPLPVMQSAEQQTTGSSSGIESKASHSEPYQAPSDPLSCASFALCCPAALPLFACC